MAQDEGAVVAGPDVFRNTIQWEANEDLSRDHHHLLWGKKAFCFPHEYFVSVCLP